MKGKVFAFFSALIVVCMLFSCGGGSGSDSDSAQKAVAVGIDIEINDSVAKAIKVTDQNYNDLEVWYKATPQWTSDELKSIQGTTLPAATSTTPDYIKLTDTANSKFKYPNFSGEVGYFAQGKWEIKIQIRKPISDKTAAEYPVLWETPSTQPLVFINENNKSFTFTVEKNTTLTGTGTVKFDVSTNKKGITDYYEVSYSKIGTTDSGIISGLEQAGIGNTTDDYVTLKGTTSLPVGFYAVTVKYYSAIKIDKVPATDTEPEIPEVPARLVGVSTVAAEIIPGGFIEVKGTIENQEYQKTAFTIKGMYKLGLTVKSTSITGESTESGFNASGANETVPTVAVNTPLTFNATPSLKDLAGNPVSDSQTYYYIWNGVSSESATYNYKPTVPGNFYVDCIVYFKSGDNVIGSASTTFRFKAE